MSFLRYTKFSTVTSSSIKLPLHVIALLDSNKELPALPPSIPALFGRLNLELGQPHVKKLIGGQSTAIGIPAIDALSRIIPLTPPRAQESPDHVRGVSALLVFGDFDLSLKSDPRYSVLH